MVNNSKAKVKAKPREEDEKLLSASQIDPHNWGDINLRGGEDSVAVDPDTDRSFSDQYPEEESQTPQELMDLYGWESDLQFAADEAALPQALRDLRRDLALFRQRCAILNYSGNTFIHWVDTNKGLQFQPIPDFHSYNGQYNHNIDYEDAGGKKRTKNLVVTKEFMRDPRARRYEGVEFAPGQGNTNFLNLWKGWSLKPGAGDIALFHQLLAALCNDDAACQEYLLNYLAHIIQKPEEKPEVAVVLRGAQGIGKGTLMKVLASFTGNYKHLSGANSLSGDFSGHLMDAFIVFADEAVWGGDKTAEGRLKAMITEKTMSIRAMRKDEIYVRSFIRLFVASNEDWVVPVGENDRRYFVLDCDPRYMGQTQPGQFFDVFDKWARAGGNADIFGFLSRRDISAFNARNFPKTAARVDMQIRSLSPANKFIYELMSGTAAMGNETMTKEAGSARRFFRNALYQDFKDWHKEHYKSFLPSENDFGTTFSKAFNFKADNENWRTSWSRRVDGRNEYYYKFDSIKTAMERFALNVLGTEAANVFFNYGQQEPDSQPGVVPIHRPDLLTRPVQNGMDEGKMYVH